MSIFSWKMGEEPGPPVQGSHHPPPEWFVHLSAQDSLWAWPAAGGCRLQDGADSALASTESPGLVAETLTTESDSHRERTACSMVCGCRGPWNALRRREHSGEGPGSQQPEDSREEHVAQGPECAKPWNRVRGQRRRPGSSQRSEMAPVG